MLVNRKERIGYVMIILIVFWMISFVLNPIGDQQNVFYAKTSDLFADFFNVLIYTSDRNPYFNEVNGFGEKGYLPLSYLIVYPFTCFTDYSKMTLKDCWQSQSAMISCVIFVFSSFAVYLHSIKVLLKQKKISFWPTALIICSSVLLFSLERGNTIILSVALLNYYLAYYNADNKYLRYFSLISLCIVSVLKVYPVLLGLLLLRDKRYKDIAFCILLSLTLTFLPFLFFRHGFDNIPQLLSNLQVNTDSYAPNRIYPRFGLASLLNIPLLIMHASDKLSQNVFLIANIGVAMASLFSLILAFFEKRVWVAITLILFIIIQLPVNSGLYSGMYLFPFIILFIAKQEKDWFDGLFIVLIILALCPLQLVIKNISLNYMITNSAVLLMWFILIVSSIRSLLLKLEQPKAQSDLI